MNCSKKIFFLVQALFLILNHVDSVEAGGQVIKEQCRVSGQPKACLSCVMSDHDALKADAAAIAGIVVGCMMRQLSALSTNMSDLARQSMDPRIVMPLHGCSFLYDQAARLLANVVPSLLKNHAFEGANRSVGLATESIVACIAGFNTKFTFPPNVTRAMGLVDELADAATRILDKLSLSGH